MTHEDVRVSEARQTDDSKVSEMGHVGQDVGETDDDLSDESHETNEWLWVINDNELDEISELWGWRLIEADDIQITIVILNIIWLVGIFSNWIN